VEIRPERCRTRVTIGERDVAVGPDEVDGIARKSGMSHFAMPRERVQRQLPIVAKPGDFGPGLAIDMNLPVERAKRREVVAACAWFSIEPYPGQPVTALHVSGRPFA